MVGGGVFEVFDLCVSLLGVWVNQHNLACDRVQDKAQSNRRAHASSANDRNP
jgi:hypothetical protein